MYFETTKNMPISSLIRPLKECLKRSITAFSNNQATWEWLFLGIKFYIISDLSRIKILKMNPVSCIIFL